MSNSSLFPPIQPYRSGRLPVGEGHELYFEESGNKDGKPVLFLHGGPGGGCAPAHRRFWDPSRHRIVLFDQRGCGRSTPFASLDSNTTWHLISDIEQLRQHLEIERWQIFGGSWGSTLGLIYAIKHPHRVTEMIFRGVFLLRAQDIDWFYRDGASRFFPDAWARFIDPIPEGERDQLVEAYYRRLTSENQAERSRFAQVWSTWETSTARLLPEPALEAKAPPTKFAEAFARIECHYFIHRGFLERDNYILDNLEHLKGIPCTIVQGRYDVICPPTGAYALHQTLPQSRLEFINDAGHSALEPGIRSALVEATQAFQR
ncbi:MAG: prolyl aminopeptidase [Myxococcota bacterium]